MFRPGRGRRPHSRWRNIINPSLLGLAMHSALPRGLVLVEDDAGDALLTRELIEAVAPGLEVTWVRSLFESDAVLDESTDCVLLDLGLPDAMGLQALTHVIKRAPAAAVLVLTGLSDEGLGLEALAHGAQDYLIKDGLEAGHLERAVRYATERKRAQSLLVELVESRLRAEENSRLERGLLPIPVLNDPAISVLARYRPGRRRALLGGDFYDVVEDVDGTLNVLVGDVCGHGPDQAAVGVSLRLAWRALVLSDVPADRRLPLLATVFEHEGGASAWSFATVSMVVIAPDRTNADVYTAGHPRPIVLGVGQLTQCVIGPPVGVFPGQTWQPTNVELPPGFTLVAFTDGLIEGMDHRTGERLEPQVFLDVLDSAEVGAGSDDAWLDRLIETMEGLNSGPLNDDVAIVAVHHSGG